MIHNRYLPESLHRLVNALAIAALWCAAGIGLWTVAPAFSTWFTIARWCVYATPAIFLGSLFLRRSVVRGVAGGEGYDELSPATGRPARGAPDANAEHQAGK